MLQSILFSLLIMTFAMGTFAYFFSSGVDPLKYLGNNSGYSSLEENNRRVINKKIDQIHSNMEDLAQRQSDTKGHVDYLLQRTKDLAEQEHQKQEEQESVIQQRIEDQKQRIEDQKQRILDQ